MEGLGDPLRRIAFARVAVAKHQLFEIADRVAPLIDPAIQR